MKLLFKKGYQIYRVFPKDWEEIGDEITFIESLAFGEGRETKDELEKIFTDPQNICLIAIGFDDEEEEICGYTSGGPLLKFKKGNRRPEIYFSVKNVPDEKVFYIHSLVVHPGYRRQGIGTNLVRNFIKEVRKEGAKAITAHCMNRISTHLMEKLDFEEIHYVKNCGSRGAHYMALILD